MLKNLIDSTTEFLTNREKKQKQQIINDFINPFYADYEESEELSLNQKDLQKIFQKRQEMEDNLDGTPKHQLKQLFQTRRQEQKVQDVLKKASLTTLKKLKKGVEEFDLLLLRVFINDFNKRIDIDKISFFVFEHRTSFKRKLFSLRREMRRLFLRRNYYKETYEYKKLVLETLLDDIIETLLYDNDNKLQHHQSFKRMIYKLQLWFMKRYRPKFLDLYMLHIHEDQDLKFEIDDDDYPLLLSQVFGPKYVREGDLFAPIINVIHDMFFNFWEFREHIKKMYLGQIEQDEIETSYNNLFDKIVKHIARKENGKIIEEANKMLGNHKQLQQEANYRNLISPINYQLMSDPVTLRTIDVNGEEHYEGHSYDRSEMDRHLQDKTNSPFTNRRIVGLIDNQQKRRETMEFAKRVIQQQRQIKTLLKDLKNLNPKYELKREGFGYTATLPIASQILTKLSNRSELSDDHIKEINSILKQKTEKDAMFKIGKSPAFGTKYPNFDSFKSQNRKK